MAAIPREVLEAFGLRSAVSATRLQRGSLNRNFRIETNLGRFFVRNHRQGVDIARAEREHRVIAWAGERGIPVVKPIPARTGSTVVELDQSVWSVFPWVDGITPRRDRISKRMAFALGQLHGCTQAAMAGNPDASGESRLAWDSDATIVRLRQLRGVNTAQGDADGLATGLEWQLAMVQAGSGRPTSEFMHLPVQALHMDFHDKQVIWSARWEVGALVDWEMAGANPRVYELLRSLSFSRLLGPGDVEAYIRGFAESVALTREECYDGVELWWQTRLHEVWAVTEYLVGGNPRVKAFLPVAFASAMQLSDPAYRRNLAARIWESAH